MIRITVWDEYIQSRDDEAVKRYYPNGIHEYIAGFLSKESDFTVRCANLHEDENGLTQEILDNTDVLIWWSHVANHHVSDEVVERVYKRVLSGMSAIFLHSSHTSKPFVKLMGTSGALRCREGHDNERLWVVAPAHPIVRGLGQYIELPLEEMYGELFDIPEPDKLIMIGWFKGGEVFRSLCEWDRGHGKVIYFQPGHETYPNYHIDEIQKVIINAVRYSYSGLNVNWTECVFPKALEKDYYNN